MPIYEFECAMCGARFEELVRAGERAPCPQCESSAAESNTRRKEREARRQEGFREDRKRRGKA